ncbi:MAG: hypothetical protein EOS27_10255 [Mesorhizobium sp.]|nr:MAG: hypothetical protein EOS27_10255 [Mesorhizobium sp.]
MHGTATLTMTGFPDGFDRHPSAPDRAFQEVNPIGNAFETPNVRTGGFSKATTKAIVEQFSQKVDPGWASKIQGTAQKTGKDSWHADASYRKAAEYAKDPKVASVSLNRSIDAALGTNTISKQRPDITVTFKDGTSVHICECVSTTQSKRSQDNKNNANARKLDEAGYKPSTETIERGGGNDPTGGKATGEAPTKGFFGGLFGGLFGG